MSDPRVEEPVTCPVCSAVQPVETSAVRYACNLCTRSWVWGCCGGCARLQLVPADEESWPCARCHRYTRSWWRSTTADEDARRIVRRRHEQRTGRALASQVAPRRRRRRAGVVAAGVVAVLGAGILTVSSMSRVSVEDHDRAACNAFAEARSAAANGEAVRDGAAERSWTALRAEASLGSPEVAAAVRDLSGAGRPGTSAFLVAQTKLVQLCARPA